MGETKKVKVSSVICAVLAVIFVAACTVSLFIFKGKKEDYLSAKKEYSAKISSQNEEYEKNRQILMNNNSEREKLANEAAKLSEKVESANNDYMKITNYDKCKMAYLTFDDGPSENTLKVLEVLKKNNVKATFFVTAQWIENADYMKKIVEDGHTIGLHTYSHDYKYIYSSTDNYFKDLQKIHDLVKEKTGVDSKVIRFPGGSSNTMSEKYSKGIMTKLTKMVRDKGYAYFDWNCDSTDASGNGIAPEKLVQGTVNSAGKQRHICVLMHDTAAKSTTVEALPKIIKELKKKGYSFDKLTADGPEANEFHHHVNN